MTDRPAWPAGTRVAVLDRSRVMAGVVLYRGEPCPEDGANTYRIRFDDVDGFEADVCQSVLVAEVEQSSP
jgi:hypothetical protein